jgi:hypothetical protein
MHTASNLHVYIAVKGFLPQIVVANDVIQKKLERHLHVLLYQSSGVLRYIVLMSAPPNLASGVLMTLFHVIFSETMLAVCVVSSYT